MDLKDMHSGMNEKHFWLVAKRNMIDILMQRAAGGLRNLSILNIGAGTGEDFLILKKYGKLSVIDIDAETVVLMPAHLVEAKFVADACAMPFKNESFDLIVAFDVLEHIPNDTKAVSEILRCLKPGGSFVFSVPAFNFLFSRHDELLGHVRRYDKKMIRSLLCNFELRFLSFWFFFLFIPAAVWRLLQRYGIIPQNRAEQMGLFNGLGGMIMRFENALLRVGARFPWGLALIGIVRKPIPTSK